MLCAWAKCREREGERSGWNFVLLPEKPVTTAVQTDGVGVLRSDLSLRVFLKTVTYFISVFKTHLGLLSIHSR